MKSREHATAIELQFNLEVLTFLQGYAAGAKEDILTEEAKVACREAFNHVRFQMHNIEDIFAELEKAPFVNNPNSKLS